jgi:hypothetical protein
VETGQLQLLAPARARLGETFEIVVSVDAGELGMDAAAAYLDFDPESLQVVQIVGGKGFDIELANQIDNTMGSFGYAAATLGAKLTGRVELAVVTLRAKGSGSLALRFNRTAPRLSDVTSSGRSFLGAAPDASIEVVHSPGTCIGDCDASGEVTVDEVGLAVSVALGNGDAGSCPAADASGDSAVTIDEITAAVDNALQGCSSSSGSGNGSRTTP